MKSNLQYRYQAQFLQDAYALIKVAQLSKKGASRTVRIPIPASIGSSYLCDLIINSPAVAPARAVVLRENGETVILDPRTGETMSNQDLLSYGIRVVGTVPRLVQDHDKRSVSDSIHETLEKEKFVWRGIRNRYPKIPLGAFSQKMRLAGLSLVCLAAIAALSFNDEVATKPQTVDYSQTPISLVTGKVFKPTLGVSGKPSGYEKGIRFTLNISKRDKIQNYLFSFLAKELDQTGEVVAKIGNETLYTYDLNQTCVSTYCEQSFQIPARMFDWKSNVTLRLIHNDPSSDYLIKMLVATPVREMRPEEFQVIERTLKAAERSYGERHIAQKNIITARSEAKKLKLMISKYSGQEEMKTRLKVLSVDIEVEFSRIVKEQNFQIQKAVQLADFHKANLILKKMLLLFPNTDSHQHRQIKKKIEEVRVFL